MDANPLFDNYFALPLAALFVALAVALPGSLPAYMNHAAAPAPRPERFPWRSFTRAVLSIFLIAFNLGLVVSGFARPSELLWDVLAALIVAALWPEPSSPSPS